MVTVKELLAEPQLVQDQWFHLDGASPESQLLLRAELKVRKQTHQPTHKHTGSLVFKNNISIMMLVFSVLNLFTKDSGVQNGGYDQLRDSALCCPWLWIWKWAGKVVSFICLPGQTAHRHRPCMQVCFLKFCFKHPQSDCVLTSDVLLA